MKIAIAEKNRKTKHTQKKENFVERCRGKLSSASFTFTFTLS